MRAVEAPAFRRGERHAKAKYYPEDQGFLLDFAEEVEHFEVFDAG